MIILSEEHRFVLFFFSFVNNISFVTWKYYYLHILGNGPKSAFDHNVMRGEKVCVSIFLGR